MLHEEYMDLEVAKVGDTVRGDYIEEMMCCLPPIMECDSRSQVGEPYAHASDGKRWRPIFLTWHLSERCGNSWSHESIWTFDGACFAGENVNRYKGFE